MKKQINIQQILYFVLGIVGITFFAAFQIKVNIGIGPWDGLGRSISYLTNLKVGTVSVVLSSSCVFLQLLFLGRKFSIANIFQLIVGLSMGSLINFFYYTVFANLSFSSYPVTLLMFVLSIFGSAFFVAVVQTAHFINLPLEGLCEVITNKFNLKFAVVRQLFDVLSVVGIVLITWLGQVPLTLREGTIISMIIFSPIMGYFIIRLKNWIIKINLFPLQAIEEN